MATLKLYRCLNPNCQKVDGGGFQSDFPACPQCKKVADDPKFGHLIQRLVMIHFDPPSDVPGIGQGYRACDHSKSIQAMLGDRGVPNPWHAGTGTANVVTCPACKETAEWKAATAALEDEDGPSLTEAAMGVLQTAAR